MRKGDAPAGEDDLPQRFAAVGEMAVPGEGHEDVGDGEENDGAQGASACAKTPIACGRKISSPTFCGTQADSGQKKRSRESAAFDAVHEKARRAAAKRTTRRLTR